ncbi:unnamed protein product [Heterobilharzia americana]|nr:unnamed protein product [Heterobilharzia americana]
MVNACIRLILATICLQIIPCQCNSTVHHKSDVNTSLVGPSSVEQIGNPVKSLSLHYCPSARGINCSDPNATLSTNKSDIGVNIPIGHLAPRNHELKSISINFDAKCLPQVNPLLPRSKETMACIGLQKFDARFLRSGNVMHKPAIIERNPETIGLTQKGDVNTSLVGPSSVEQIGNPVKSLSLHYCPSARGINCSDPNATLSTNKSDIGVNIPIGHLAPRNHELKSISINFDAKCLPQVNPRELNMQL